MRDVLVMMIEENGGRVISAANGKEALERFRQHAAEIDVAVLDFSMPQLNGYEVCRALSDIKPGVGVVLISGLSRTAEVESLERGGSVRFLGKPFEERALIEAINRVNAGWNSKNSTSS